MNALRRTAVLLTLTVSVIVGSSIPASATFAESLTLATRPTLSAVTVAAPASITISRTCTTAVTGGYYNAYGQWVPTYTSYYNATVTWPASTTARGVTGYLVTAYLNNGTSVVMGQTDATNRSVRATVNPGYLAYSPTITVTTLTSYGWSTESARKAVPAC